MSIIIFSCLLLYTSSTLSATTVTNSTQLPLTLNVTFVIKPDKIPSAIANLIVDEGIPLKHSISTKSFEEILDLKTLNSTQLIMLIKNATNVNVTEHLFEIFDALNISYIKTFSEFKSTLKSSKDLEAFANLKLDYVSLLFEDQNETAFRMIFKNGSFSTENINEALKRGNKTQEEVLDFLQTIILKNIFDRDFSDLVNILRPFGLLEILETFFTTLKIDADKFKIGEFGVALTAFKDYLDNMKYKPVATPISPNTSVTSDLVYYTLLSRDYLFIDLGEGIIIKNLTFTNNYLNISMVNQTTNYIPIALDYSKGLKNCSYMNQTVHPNGFYVNKSKSIFYLPGSPLVCQNNLYGIASQNFTNYIGFTGFNKTRIALETTVPLHEITATSSSLSIFGFTWLVTVLSAMWVYKYLN